MRVNVRARPSWVRLQPKLSFQSNGPYAHSVKQWDMGQHHDEAAECDQPPPVKDTRLAVRSGSQGRRIHTLCCTVAKHTCSVYEVPKPIALVRVSTSGVRLSGGIP